MLDPILELTDNSVVAVGEATDEVVSICLP